ncbi:piwi-like protein Siwi [Monomorium pharaonis]|uniref:piwi-like protein Siwi n=1 Tax=Monomorium pharaonis TaxID=307658 RepID=UPI001745F61C|nr:piwi-like protein Siwi [Monomorium pharaonis]XP_036145934.1 piwi-like protein Siwi [Monomorium pharaonis]XP_036145935.1 piwi-like protein Siwi [Monomorium pharaonis]XP_036145936.1 piwi-like protein Siwi [Monomorium pharaonis]XP_036145937.1 piwi-like protein Siwi [Monomorium pharaonis]XP_036145938.1 piwi-like protein Siwi [Monomorium pharaonis]XP_036145939.1 piwi-like protein Siwi [Monomorium pharaonis]XP_036145941.1 piwi-like protein Siwi [Monomorium pharaonis]
MSKQERGYDIDEPSTSTSYRKKPYDRGSESERAPSRGIVKKIKQEDDPQPSTSQYVPMEIKEEESEIKSEIKSESGSTKETRSRRKLEPIFVSKPSTLVTKKGTSGEHTMLQSNHFKLPTVPNWRLYQYRVDFEPEEMRTFIRKGMLKLHKDKVGPYIFDGTVLYTSTRLPDKMEFTSVRQSDNVPVNIVICFVGPLSPEDPHFVVIFNIIMRKCLEYLRLQLVGRDYYDANNKVIINQFRLELWPGYITSIRQYENDVLLCAEISHKVMRQETLLHILIDCRRRSDNYKAEFSSYVLGIMVLTDYNNYTYKIEDVDFETCPASTFPMKNGEHISYQEYYRKKYKIEITNPTQPMLVTKTKRKGNAGQELVYLVPELCRATGLTESMKENFHLMKALAHHTCIAPASRIEKLMRFNHRLRGEPKVIQELQDWNMTLERNLVEIPGRVLPNIPLSVANGTINKGQQHGNFNQRGDWSRDMQRAYLLHSKELRNWIVITSSRSEGMTWEFVKMIKNVSRSISFRVEDPHIESLYDDKASAYTEKLETILSKYAPDLIFCVVSNSRTDRYAAIKKKCCLDRPVPSQVFLQKNLNGRNTMSIATKVAIQMNCKLGGAPWTIDNDLKGLMTIGFDVCRDSRTTSKDFLAMVATVDQRLTRYFSSISLYSSSEDLADQLCVNLSKAVMAYRSYNKALPMHLVIYRDGVSEGQVRQVYETEVERLKKKLEEMYYGPNFKMIFIIVTKKINVRLFKYKNNPPIGTVVDDVITNPLRYDFYLVSQQVRQGTISPTSYNVIYDNTGLDADTIQTLTFKLTHIYYNCSSTVRVPAPCHYAKKLSFLVGRFLHRPPSSQLENRLFFL